MQASKPVNMRAHVQGKQQAGAVATAALQGRLQALEGRLEGLQGQELTQRLADSERRTAQVRHLQSPSALAA